MQTSKGQNGGALTVTETGGVLGIFYDSLDLQGDNEKLAVFVRMRTKIVDWVNELWEKEQMVINIVVDRTIYS